MSKTKKLLAAAQNNPRGLRFAELLRLIAAAGFVERRQVGSHRIFSHATRSEVPMLNLQEAANGMAKPYQVEQVFEWIETFDLEVL